MFFISLNLFVITIVLGSTLIKPEVKLNISETSTDKSLDFICKESQTNVYFKLDKKGQLICNEQIVENSRMVNANYFSKRLYFDEFSKIQKLSITSNNDAKLKTNVIESDVIIEGIFHHDTKQFLVESNFVNKNAEFEFSYLKSYSDPKFFNRLFINQEYPITNKTLTIVVPDWIDLEIVEYNLENYKVDKKVDDIKNGRKITYTFANLEAISLEKNSVGPANIYPHLVFIIKSFRYKDNIVNVIRNVDDLFFFYNSLVKTVNNDDEKLLEVVQSIISDCDNDLCKIEKLFYWVQDNIRYIAFENGIMGFKPEGAYSVYYNRYGDCKGMANLLRQLLVIAGFEAKLGWIGTKGIPYDYSMPSLVVDNHMICVLEYDNEKYFLDATENYIPINEYAYRISGRQVLSQHGETYIIDTVPTMPIEHNLIEKTMRIELIGSDLIGLAKSSYFGEEKTQLLRNYYNTKMTDRDKQLELFISNYDKNINARVLDAKNLDNRTEPIEIYYEFVASNKITTTNSLIYISFDFDKEFAELSIDTLRQTAFNLYTTKNLRTVTEIVFPETMGVEFMPASVNIENENFVFNLIIENNENTIVYKKFISIRNPIISKSFFVEWNNSIKQIRNFYRNQIILKRK